MFASKSVGISNRRQTMNDSTDEFRDERGLATTTSPKKIFNCSASKSKFFVRKIFDTKFPPGRKTWRQMLKAAKTKFPWMNSSMSCKPVTSGAPSQITKSALFIVASLLFSNFLRISSIVERFVMSPLICSTPSNGAIVWRSTATIFTLSGSELLYNIRDKTCDQLPKNDRNFFIQLFKEKNLSFGYVSNRFHYRGVTYHSSNSMKQWGQIVLVER